MTYIVREPGESVELIGCSRTYSLTQDYVAWVKAEAASIRHGLKSKRAYTAVKRVADNARLFGGWQEFHRCMQQLESL